MKYQPPIQISLNTIGNITISTVLLPKMFVGETDQWETCLFYEDDSESSRVLSRYNSKQDAIEWHNKFVKHEFELQLDRKEI
jgi:hypothetical protein